MGQIYNPTLGRYVELTSDPSGEIFATDRHKSFFEGKEFRTYFDFSSGNGTYKVIKFVSPVNFILHLQDFSLDDGELRFEAVVQGTEGGSFATALPIVGTNRTNERPTPLYTSVASLTTGGTHTGGTIVELLKMKTANASAQQSTVGAALGDERALPPGTYYLRFNSVSATEGIYTLRWEERP